MSQNKKKALQRCLILNSLLTICHREVLLYHFFSFFFSHALLSQSLYSSIVVAQATLNLEYLCLTQPRTGIAGMCHLHLAFINSTHIFFFSFFVFQDRVSLCSPSCPGTHKVPPASASRVLGLKE